MAKHNPEKNRAACALAKGSVWGLRGLLAITVLTVVIFAIAVVVIKIRADWSWAEAGKITALYASLIAVGCFIYGLFWLLGKWYGWAKRYSRNC